MNIFDLAFTRCWKILSLLIFFSWLLPPFISHALETPFPLYPEIENNVSFWQDVYTRYSTKQGILHDNENLTIIYGIIDLEPKSTPKYRLINKKRIDAAKKKYHSILKELIRNPNTENQEAKKIAALFGPNTGRSTYQKAILNIRCQIGQKDRFLEGIKRSGAYLTQIRKIFDSYGIPMDLAYLPHVESSFDTNAYSKFGAAGMWQFTLGTGRRFLKIGYTIDERRDPIAAAHAAALLLKENYEKLKNWPLAITAYNHGAAGMQRAQEQWGDYPMIYTHYRSRTFKFASRNFYPEFLAARIVAQSHKQYFGEINLLPVRKTYSMVLEGYAALDDIIDTFKVDIDTLQKLNPAVRPPVFKGQKHLPQGYRLHLPTWVSDTESNLASLFPRERYHAEQKPSLFYAVQRGDTAGKIARMHKVRLSDLLLANKLDRHSTIYVNQNLRIPSPGEHTSQTERLKPDTIVELLELPKIPQPVLASILPLNFEKEKTQTKAPMAVIATTARPSAETPLNPEVISGKLKIEKIWTENGNVLGLIKVEVEETLGHLADWLEIKTQVLRRINGLRYGRYVHIGQSLKIPLERVSKEIFEEKRFDYHKRLQEDFFNAYQIEEMQPYHVRKGDNIWMLSNQKFNLPVWLIQQCNPAVDFYNLRHTQKLMIPVVEKQG